MALFEFSLLPVDDIDPWGEYPNEVLHWFALSLGSYHINLDNTQLFRYSDEIIKHWQISDPSFFVANHFDIYQIARLHSDILTIVPNILQPIPIDLKNHFRTIEDYISFEKLLDRYSDRMSALELIDDKILEDATRWFTNRTLPTDYLTPPPKIILWRHHKTIWIYWNNLEAKMDGIPVWSARCGLSKLDLNFFIEEILTFHNKFITEMNDRISYMEQYNFSSNVKINMMELIVKNLIGVIDFA